MIIKEIQETFREIRKLRKKAQEKEDDLIETLASDGKLSAIEAIMVKIPGFGGGNMTEAFVMGGGARPGSGRKPADPEDKRVQMVITIDRDTRDKIKARAKAEHVRVGRLIDEWMGEA